MPSSKPPRSVTLEKDPYWYKNGIIYEAHVRAFSDSDGNGVGDFRGLTQKLDYLHDLGVTAIWLLPFYPSPLKDDGYDIADYYTINPTYGTLADFKTFLREAHRRGLRVITELVINHTSDQHPWFQKSRRAKPGSKWRDYYVWSDNSEPYRDARIIFKDFETSNWTWDPVAKAYFWHRFYSHQPDLNFDNPQVHRDLVKIMDFWLDMGVDGLRLDAIPYLYEREGTSCENLDETHVYLKSLRKHVDKKYGDRMLLAEANQWPEDAVAYFGSGTGDECHMAFHFPLMPRLFMAVRMEDRVPIVDILEQTPAIPETSQWALFLRNHDELTLEMVTDEERDYMYRVYANDPKSRINLGIRRRLAPLLGNDRKRIELLNALLFSLPGTPVLYYGDEIGMGENIHLGDRNGVRTPMHWTADRNAGFSRANPQSLYLPVITDPEYNFETINVEAQQQNPHSLLWWMKRMLSIRRQWRAFGEGSIEFLHPENRKILAYVRRHENECILVVANLSRFSQPVELDLSAFAQSVPVEIFGRVEFPQIGPAPYFLTLGPHTIFWFSLEPRYTAEGALRKTEATRMDLPELAVAERWDQVFAGRARGGLETILSDHLVKQRWFRGKARKIKSLEITDSIPVAPGAGAAVIALIEVDYVQGDPETYLLPLTWTSGDRATAIHTKNPQFVICRLRIRNGDESGLLIDAAADRGFCATLFDLMHRRRTIKGKLGDIQGGSTAQSRGRIAEHGVPPVTGVGSAEQSNTAVLFGDQFILKMFRRPEPGLNPDLEIGRFLTKRNFPHSPPLAGSLEYVARDGNPTALAILTGLVPESTDAWDYTLDALGRYYERILTLPEPDRAKPPVVEQTLRLLDTEAPSRAAEVIRSYLESARLLGDRTARMHLALASEKNHPDFAPEPFTPFYQRSLFQSMRNLTSENFKLLRQRLRTLPESLQEQAQSILDQESTVLKRLRCVTTHKLRAMRIRCHGDYHLGQVLSTGKDFMIIDFEGEPARSLSARRLKQSPIRDVAGMLRSFHYATHAALLQEIEGGRIGAIAAESLEPWAQYWAEWVGVVFLQTYLQVAEPGQFLPVDRKQLLILLAAQILDKAVYELGYELNNRPDWIRIPLHGIEQILASDALT